MPRDVSPKVVTANALFKGDVIYLTEDDNWTRHLSQAEIFTDEALAQIRLLDAQSRSDEAVSVYLADVRVGAKGPQPVHFREEFRQTGPSNYSHGKQAG